MCLEKEEEWADFDSGLTWIIIVLILLSILVTCSEVFIRFGILSTHDSKRKSLPLCVMPSSLSSSWEGSSSISISSISSSSSSSSRSSMI